MFLEHSSTVRTGFCDLSAFLCHIELVVVLVVVVVVVVVVQPFKYE